MKHDPQYRLDRGQLDTLLMLVIGLSVVALLCLCGTAWVGFPGPAG